MELLKEFLVAMRKRVSETRGRIDSLSVTHRNDVLYVDIEGFVPREDIGSMQEAVDLLQQYLSESLNEPLILEVAVPLDSFKFVSVPESLSSISAR